MKDDKAKDATSVENAPRMTRDETPAAAMAPVAAVAAATPKRAAKKSAGKKGASRKGTARAAAAKAKSAAKATKSPGKSSTRRAAARSSSAVAAAPKAAARPAVAKAAVAKAAVAKPPVAKPVDKAPASKRAAAVPQPAADVAGLARKALPVGAAQAASTALQSALRGVTPGGGVFPAAEAALAPFSAVIESGAEQARKVVGRARDRQESLQQAVAHSAAAAANGMLELNGKVIDLLRAQSDAAFAVWRSALTAGSLSEAVRIQTSGIRQAYEATTTHAKDVAEAATRAIGDTVKPLQSAIAPTPR